MTKGLTDWHGEQLLDETIQDISERNIMERSQLNHAERWNALMKVSRDGIVVFDEELTVVEANHVFASMLGYAPQEMVGLHPWDWETQLSLEDLLALYGDGGIDSTKTFFTVLRRRDGHLIDIEAHICEYVQQDRVFSFCITRDISDRKEAERERIRLEEQFRQAQKMEAIGQLASGIAHDFNNMLTTIIGNSSIALMKSGEDSPFARNLNQINYAAEKAAALTRDLLTFSRKQVTQHRPIDLNEALANSEQLMRRLIREDIELIVSGSDSPLTVIADESQLTQVFLNLTSNARDAISHRGRIAVGVSAFAMDADYVERHGYGKPGGFALITFSDTGCGMDAITRERIFEPFFTTKELGKGTGMGLASVYGIVKQLDGFINCYSEPGNGTVFRIYIPTIDEIPMAEKKEVSGPTPGGNETVLLAEDEEMVRELLEALLVGAGYNVISSSDGLEALEILEARGEFVDLLVLDVIMPAKNGTEVLRRAFEIRPDIPSILMSGYTPELIALDRLIKRGVRFVQKPVRTHQFLAVVREVLDRRAYIAH
jgi:two-component system, cell cycle sensor histidine kinase and response regulator CckA